MHTTHRVWHWRLLSMLFSYHYALVTVLRWQAQFPSHVWLFANPIDCSPPGSSVHGILQARILEWRTHVLPWGIFPTQGSNRHLLHCRQILYHWATREVSTKMNTSPSSLAFPHTSLFPSILKLSLAWSASCTAQPWSSAVLHLLKSLFSLKEQTPALHFLFPNTGDSEQALKGYLLNCLENEWGKKMN